MCTLSERYPDLTFEVTFADEDLGSNCGMYQFKDGDEIEFMSYGIEGACDIWGYDIEEIFPDIKRDRNIDRIIGE
jgi:hypothetical protein